MLEKNFEIKLGDMSPYTPALFPIPAQIADGREGVSNTYAEFIETRGYGLVRGGRFQFCPADVYRPIAALIFAGDPDFTHKDTRILGFDAFGMELTCWSEKHNLVKVDLLRYQVRCTALAPIVFAMPLPVPKKTVPINRETLTRMILPADKDTGECWDWREDRMYAQAVKAYGALEFGEMYGVMPSLGITGYHSRERELKNVKRLKTLEHMALIAQLKPFHLIQTERGVAKEVRQIG